VSDLWQVLTGPTRLELAGATYSALPLRVRDLAELGRGDRARRSAAWAPYRDLLLYEPDDAGRRRWCREALEALAGDDAGDDGPPGPEWWAEYLARVLRASAPIPGDLAGRLSAAEWAEVLAIGQGLDPLDELYRAIDGPTRPGSGEPWPKVYASLCERYGWIPPDAFGDLMLPQLRALASGGECEPGAPATGDEHEALEILMRRERYLSGD
jgi:hypothetical protein